MKLVWMLPVLVLATVFGGTFNAYAGTEHNVRGWLWGGSIPEADTQPSLGWISANSLNCDTDSDGKVDNVNCGRVGEVMANYGLNIPPSGNGPITGYAWSDGYGWISFGNTVGGVPDMAGCPQEQAMRSGNSLVGGARFLSMRDGGANNGGWLGCISLSGTASDGTPYGVTINPDGTMTGMAWHGEIVNGVTVEGLGAIDFKWASIVIPKVLKICPSGLSMFVGDQAKKLQLFYDTRAPGDCSGSGTLVSALTWTAFDAFVSLSGSQNSNTGTNDTDTVWVTPVSVGTTTVRATYPGLVPADATVTVASPIACICDPAERTTHCTSDSLYTSATLNPANCNIPATNCSGTKICGGKWKEIAPVQ